MGDSVVFCSNDGSADGSARLIGADGSPSITGSGRLEVSHGGAWTPVCASGFSAGAGSVACKSMGFTGASGHNTCNGDECGSKAPALSEVACSGNEGSISDCAHEEGDDVYCAPEESVVLSCAANGVMCGAYRMEEVRWLRKSSICKQAQVACGL